MKLIYSKSNKMKLIFTVVFMMMIFLLAYAYYVVDESPTTTLSESESSPTFSEESVDKLFHDWMLKYKRIYSSSDEMKKRREIFKKKLEHVEKFNNEGIFLSIQFSVSIQ
jgi:hypothetical protein